MHSQALRRKGHGGAVLELREARRGVQVDEVADVHGRVRVVAFAGMPLLALAIQISKAGAPTPLGPACAASVLVAAMLTLLALVGIVVGPTATADVIVVVVVVRTLVVPPIRLCHEQGGMSGEGLRRKRVRGRPQRRVRGRAGRKQERRGRVATGMSQWSAVAP